MNMWGPLLSAMLPGWSRAVRGRSWPSWRPAFQLDHVLVNPPVRVVDAEVLSQTGSDHLPVRATLSVA
jgi:endonuclease/exonuclease/phosphatase family metal-dependent hydrolase